MYSGVGAAQISTRDPRPLTPKIDECLPLSPVHHLVRDRLGVVSNFGDAGDIQARAREMGSREETRHEEVRRKFSAPLFSAHLLVRVSSREPTFARARVCRRNCQS